MWTDKFGNKLTYFSWGTGEPNCPLCERYAAMLASGSKIGKWNDLPGWPKYNVICVKCSQYYPIPSRVNNLIFLLLS